MKLDNLEINKTYKSYKELCDTLEILSTGGGTKQKHLKAFKECVDYTVDGRKFIIHKIKKYNIKIVEGRGNNPNSHNNRANKLKTYSNMLIPEKEWDDVGVYKIAQGDKIYIGSTTAGFRTRFMKHRQKDSDNHRTRNMINNGGIFEIIENMTGKSKSEIRKAETMWIKQYKLITEEQGLIMVNKKDMKYRHLQGYSGKSKTSSYKIIKSFDLDDCKIITKLQKGNKILAQKECGIKDDIDTKGILKLAGLENIIDKENANETR